ncbi:RNA-dependent ATPase [Orbilia blumenaviensis]|uniref:RNA helicase n=1 Tax=Orbilia blumenaviensis TaxID=1796055 RepID=A0AAV9VL41_9PEZI
MGKKRKASETEAVDEYPAAQANTSKDGKERKSKKKDTTEKSLTPSALTNSTKEKPEYEKMTIEELKRKPENEEESDKAARKAELKKRKREDKQKAEVEGGDSIAAETDKDKKKAAKLAKKLAKQGQASEEGKRQLAEESKEEKAARKEAKRAAKAKAKEEASANGEGEGKKKKKKTKGTVTEVEETKDVIMEDAVEAIVEDKMDVDSSNSGSSESEVEKSKTPKSNGSTAPTTANGTESPAPADSVAINLYMTTHSIKITDPAKPDSASCDLILNFSDLPAVDKSHLAPFSAYKSPTPIQAASWSYLLAGKDLIGVAETGSGKTMAFAYPAVQYLSKMSKSDRNPKKSGARVVIVSPTRELAMQIFEQVEKLTLAAGLKEAATCIYGGVPKDPQRESLKKALVIVATPGRLNDFLEEGAANISQAGYVVLDEADRMLDKGFEDAIKTILGATPATPKRQTLMFTATWPQSVRQLASTFMTKPVRIGINSPDDGDLRANTRITQTVEVLADGRIKEPRLLNIINAHQRSSPGAKNDRILVFALYKKEAARLENFLRAKGIKVGGIHGDLNQATRTSTLAEFKAGRTPVLVATDVAARGLDIPNVKLVINVTFPLTIEDYVHRIGRTGRAGELGKAITFFTDHDKAHSGSLINVLKAANQAVPDDLMKFGTTVKKKEHASYGAFYKDTSDAKAATKIKFDD